MLLRFLNTIRAVIKHPAAYQDLQSALEAFADSGKPLSMRAPPAPQP